MFMFYFLVTCLKQIYSLYSYIGVSSTSQIRKCYESRVQRVIAYNHNKLPGFSISVHTNASNGSFSTTVQLSNTVEIDKQKLQLTYHVKI